jgi:hypothetical protein
MGNQDFCFSYLLLWFLFFSGFFLVSCLLYSGLFLVRWKRGSYGKNAIEEIGNNASYKHVLQKILSQSCIVMLYTYFVCVTEKNYIVYFLFAFIGSSRYL